MQRIATGHHQITTTAGMTWPGWGRPSRIAPCSPEGGLLACRTASQIEGTQSSLSDLLLFKLEEAPGVPFDDVGEVSSYGAAVEHGLARMASGFPLSCRWLREFHDHPG
jgi:hypothetical protein